MSATISINNFSPNNILEKLQLNADAVVSGSPVALNVVNNQNVSANDFIIIGGLGTEDSELQKVSSVSGANSITVPTVKFPHVRFGDVTKLFGDQITVYRAPNVDGTQPTDDQFVTFSGNSIALDTDQMQTSFTDPNGSSDYWYKFVYTNSVSSLSTQIGDSSSARGQGTGDYCSLQEIRNSAGFNRAPYITDEMIDEKRQAAQATINGALTGIYTIPFTEPINPFIRNITITLAAGWLLLDQYDPSSTRGASGQAKVDSVMNDKDTGYLDKLQLGSMKIVDSAGTDTSSADSGGFSGWPNDTTASTDKYNGGGGNLFRIGGVEGYRNRDY